MRTKQLRFALSVPFLLALIFMVSHARAGQVRLAWNAPTTNADGTFLTDLTSYTLYYWQANWEFPARVDVGNQTTYDLAELNLDEEQTYSFAITAFDASGNESTFSNEISYTVPIAPPVANFSASTVSGSAPFIIAFTDASTGTITSRTWDFGDGGSSTEQHPTHTYGADDTYTVSLTVTGPGGSDTITRTLDARVTAGQVALSTFDEGQGTTAHDTCGVDSPLGLTMADASAISWTADGGLTINAPTMLASAGAATKVIDAIRNSNEFTLEAWLIPANTSQNGPARIVTISQDPYQRNVTLGQGIYGGSATTYDMRLRTTATSTNGTPSLTTPAGTLTTALTHVVYTRDASGVTRLYVLKIDIIGDGSLISQYVVWFFQYGVSTGIRPMRNDIPGKSLKCIRIRGQIQHCSPCLGL